MEHRIRSRAVFVEPGALEESAAFLRREIPSRARIWVLSDENTEEAAGARWKDLADAGRVVSRVLPREPVPVPTGELVGELVSEARAARVDLLVAVGAGVISDLVKSVSREVDVPNWCVATAPSVDAYSSATSALRVNGFHSAVPARVSEVIVCDPAVVCAAPRELFLAGLGDLLAKFLAHLDWNISRMVTGEWYCPVVAEVALASARGALAAAHLLREDSCEAVRTLMDACLSSGFAMQATGGSRPAASAEHMLAHFWETTDAAHVQRWALHGILAAAASRMMLPAYRALHEKLRTYDPDDQGRLRLYDAEPGWRESMDEALLPFSAKIAEEAGGRQFDRGVLATRLYAWRVHRWQIAELARAILDEMERAVGMLVSLGYPFSPRELGLGRAQILLPLRNVRLLRRRYSSFDLAYELGLESVLMEECEKCLGSVPSDED
jgi:glycerol-1-phosphate dehydrogenase [NAD(P)+]